MRASLGRRRAAVLSIFGVFVVGLAATGVALAGDSGPTGQIVGNGNLCLDVAWGNPTPGTPVQIANCTDNDAQKWTREGETLRALGKCLDVTWAGTESGTKVQIADCNGTGAQAWRAENGTLVNAGSGKCLDVIGNGASDGIKTQIWDCNGVAGQKWKVPGATSVEAPVRVVKPKETVTQDPGNTQDPGATQGGVITFANPDNAAETCTVGGGTAKSGKKGVATNPMPDHATAVRETGSVWFYNWANNADATPSDAEFVPMLWDERDAVPEVLGRLNGQGPLLTFNEPERPEQAAVSVNDALAMWPSIQATGRRLGSPAVASNPEGDQWRDDFMARAKAQNLKVDFIAAHWYGQQWDGKDAQRFMCYLDRVHKSTGLPIWVTEFALLKSVNGAEVTADDATNQKFIQDATRMMNTTDWIERYAWQRLPASGTATEYGLWKDGSGLTPEGQAWKAAP
jgi:hypothetical protein